MKSNQVIINWVNKDTSILDLGCGDGSILEILSLKKNVKGLGVEIDPKNIQSCIDKGINVIEQNIDEGITNFKSKSYDYVLLSETIQVLDNIISSAISADGKIIFLGGEIIGSVENTGYLWRLQQEDTEEYGDDQDSIGSYST